LWEDKEMTTNNLTELWKKGELPRGEYYVENNDGVIGSLYNLDNNGWYNIKEVLAPVPSYEEWQPFTDPYFKGLTTKHISELAKKSIRLTTQHCEDTTTIFNLKELLYCCADELEAIEDKDIEIERLLEEIEKELK
jgi:hypothetical protein